MKKIQNSILFAAVLVCVRVVAQNDVDAFRYSNTGITGTARSSSMAGAYGAVGADAGAVSINPASAGLYRKTEVIFSPGITHSGNTSTYEGSQQFDSRLSFNLNNWGITLNNKLGKDDDLPEWKSVSVGFTQNRMANYNCNTFIEGAVTGNSLMKEFVKRANGIPPASLDPFSEGLAFDAYLIDTFYVLGQNQYIPFLTRSTPVTQRRTIQSQGTFTENNFFIGGNYANKLFVGASVGINRIRYAENNVHSEKLSDTSLALQSFSYTQSLSSSGAGGFAKLGVIYMPIPYLRMGASWQTGSRISINDAYNSSVSANYNSRNYSFASDQGGYDYVIRVPAKSTFSLCVLHPAAGMLSADMELSDFSGMHIYPSSNFSEVNAVIPAKYQWSKTYRTGIEVKLSPAVSIRGGYSWNTSAFAGNANNYLYKRYSGGLGYRDKNFFVDLAAVFTQRQNDYYLYDPTLVNPARINDLTQLWVLSGGLRF